MLGTIRYQYIRNDLGVPFTFGNFPNTTDGEDAQIKVLKRIIELDDIGNDPGEAGHELGAIVSVIPPSYEVLWFLGFVSRPQTKVGNITPYNSIDNEVSPEGEEFEASFLVDENNAIRVRYNNVDLPFFSNDVVTVIAILGQRTNDLDIVNP